VLIIWEREDFPQDKVLASKAHHPKDRSDLGKSHYVWSELEGKITHKTCTRCSQEHGRLVWYLIDLFSYRILEGNKIRPQAQCVQCRSKEPINGSRPKDEQ